jgi:hypothetical protein
MPSAVAAYLILVQDEVTAWLYIGNSTAPPAPISGRDKTVHISELDVDLALADIYDDIDLGA